MASRFSGRVALVTGAARGLGAEIVRDLARQGADVAFTYVKDSAAAKSLVRELEVMGRGAVPFAADVKDFDVAGEVVERTIDQLGRLDALICNAGIARSAPVHRMSESDWDDVMNVTLKGAFNYVRAVAPSFIERRGGKIVCIGSINGLRGRVGTLSYNVAKAGLLGLVKTTAQELGRYDVNVNLVAPGFVETDSQEHTSELIRDLVLKECAIKRLGQPGDVAPVVSFLCSDAARHITGSVIKVDAGQYI
jgi:3-oxoacyl-[acyl-carrier protein] reductase